MPDVKLLGQPYGGYAPGTEFYIRRRHGAAVYTASPVEQPFRAITIPIEKMERD